MQNHWFAIRLSVILAFHSIAWGLPAIASFPVIEQNHPLGVVRGEVTTIVFKGLRLGDAYDAIADKKGVEIIEVKAIDSRKATVKLKADPNLAPGLYPIRLVTRTGISNIKLIGVGAMPITDEVEPNNDFGSPQKIKWNPRGKSFGTTIEGIVGREDVDFYQVQLKAGQRLTAEIEGIRLVYTVRNQNILDPFIAILDENRFEVASSDDSALLAQDGVCSFVAPKDGRYFVLVRGSSFGGGPICGYRLHVGNFPRPVAVIPRKENGSSKSELTADLISIDGSRSEASVELPPVSYSVDSVSHSFRHLRVTDRFGVTTEDENGVSPSPNWIRVNGLKVVSDVEPNDNIRKPQNAEAPAALCGVIQTPGDFDCYSFQANKGDKFRAQCFAREPFRSPLDAVMNVYRPNFKPLSSSDDVGNAKDPSIEFTCPTDGRYTLRIYDHLRGGSELHQYRVELTKMVPSFSVGLKETRRDNAAVAAIPMGGHTAVMTRVTRSGYNGDIQLAVDGLPNGVTARVFPIPAGRSEIPVLFSATADADFSSSLFRLVGTAAASTGKGDGPPATGLAMSQLHKIVLGQNRRMMFGYRTDFAAAAVTRPAPFKIELVQPKTPLVRRGSKNLKVTVVRNEGFVEPIKIRTLYNPPGIAINNSRKIAKGKTEADIPMTANGKAAIGQWPIVLIATYKGELGSIEVATQAIMLHVQAELFEFEFPRVAAEQGNQAIVSVGLEVKRDLPGDVEVELAGFPAGVTCSSPRQAITPEAKVIDFPITISKQAKPGKFKTLVCIARVKVGDEVVVQTNGVGEIRIDKPLPLKVQSKGDLAKKDLKKASKTKPQQVKPVSRLEQLRKMEVQQ